VYCVVLYYIGAVSCCAVSCRAVSCCGVLCCAYCVVLLIELGVVEGWFRCMLELGVVDERYV